MKIGFIISDNRMAPCFAGNELRIYNNLLDSDDYVVIDTVGWELRDWATELVKLDVEQLLCAGIDKFLYGALFGSGIVVIPNVMGKEDETKDRWRQGLISDNQEFGFKRRRQCGCGRKRCRNNG